MDNIERAKQGFEKSFSEKDFYNRQTQDDKHLETIFNMMEFKDGDKILDFGAGSGYLSFAIAKKYPNCSVVGLDIVSNTLEQNRLYALAQGIDNIEFIDYDGITLPFEDNVFDWVVTRYVLHHVPDIQNTFDEVSRILKPGGSFFISDPTPNCLDADRFVDAYMQLQNDGHNNFYTLSEFSEYAENARFNQKQAHVTTIRFPRKIDQSYIDLLKKTDTVIKQAYKIEIINDECFIVEDVLNIVFQKQ